MLGGGAMRRALLGCVVFGGLLCLGNFSCRIAYSSNFLGVNATRRESRERCLIGQAQGIFERDNHGDADIQSVHDVAINLIALQSKVNRHSELSLRGKSSSLAHGEFLPGWPVSNLKGSCYFANSQRPRCVIEDAEEHRYINLLRLPSHSIAHDIEVDYRSNMLNRPVPYIDPLNKLGLLYFGASPYGLRLDSKPSKRSPTDKDASKSNTGQDDIRYIGPPIEGVAFRIALNRDVCGGEFADNYGFFIVLGGFAVTVILELFAIAILFDKGKSRLGWSLAVGSLAFWIVAGLTPMIGRLPWDWNRTYECQEHSEQR
jgi:hypothetical protein